MRQVTEYEIGEEQRESHPLCLINMIYVFHVRPNLLGL